jgi:hypothetical protein
MPKNRFTIVEFMKNSISNIKVRFRMSVIIMTRLSLIKQLSYFIYGNPAKCSLRLAVILGAFLYAYVINIDWGSEQLPNRC